MQSWILANDDVSILDLLPVQWRNVVAALLAHPPETWCHLLQILAEELLFKKLVDMCIAFEDHSWVAWEESSIGCCAKCQAWNELFIKFEGDVHAECVS